jgi:hypothetical protein
MVPSYEQYMKHHKQTRIAKFIEVGSNSVDMSEVRVDALVEWLTEFQQKHTGKDLILRTWSDDDSYQSTGEIFNDIGYYDLEPIEEYNNRCGELYKRYVEFYNRSQESDREKEIKQLEQRLAELRG